MALRLPVFRLQLLRDFSIPLPEPTIHTPNQAACVFQRLLQGADREQFAVLAVNTKRRPLGLHIAATGRLNLVNVDLAAVFRFAIAINGDALFVAHNHPSGDPTPSAADHTLTQQLQAAGGLIDIPVLDHLILGDTAWHSLCYSDQGPLPELSPNQAAEP